MPYPILAVLVGFVPFASYIAYVVALEKLSVKARSRRVS